METIGSAERSTDKDQMRDTFYTISDGQYAQLIINLFGKERVEKELEEFLSFDFFPRSGGGIGLQRLMSALSWHSMQPGEIGKHRRLFHARSIINVVGLLGSSPRVAV